VAFSFKKSFVPDTTAKAADLNENFDDAEAVINELLEAVIPVGTVIATARPSAPTGYLLCEGQAVSRTKYANLFAAVSTTYGAGDGSTTFNLPDLRGRVPIGVDAGANRVTIASNALGKSGGNQRLQGHTHTSGSLHSDVQNASHHHHLDVTPTTRHEGNGFAYTDTAWTPGSGTNTSEDAATHSHGITGDTGFTGEGSSENLQPYQVVNYAIKV
jgi:microcystin-dependent protein